MVDEHRRMEMEKRLDEISKEIRKLKGEADKAAADTRTKMKEELRRLEAEQDKAHDQLRKAREAGTAATEDMMKGAEKAWKSLADAVDQARKRFR